VNVLGSSFRSELEAEIDMNLLPDRIGGQYTKPTEPFQFDYEHEGSALWTPPRRDAIANATSVSSAPSETTEG
jgi:hypothetical protein